MPYRKSYVLGMFAVATVAIEQLSDVVGSGSLFRGATVPRSSNHAGGSDLGGEPPREGDSSLRSCQEPALLTLVTVGLLTACPISDGPIHPDDCATLAEEVIFALARSSMRSRSAIRT